MASARQVNPGIGEAPFRTTKRSPLIAAAVLLAAVCGVAAFLFFALRDGGRTKVMVHDQAAPTTLAASSPGSKTAPIAVPPRTTVSFESRTSGDIGARNAFRLRTGSRPETLGPIRLRLTKVDLGKNTYDISVLSGRRSYSHKHLRVHEPLWIALRRGKGTFELVVTAVEKDNAEGYWTTSKSAPQVTSRAAHH